ncbi:sugar nucleotide-binding protein [Sphingobium bisphenolivorans]|uniref:sugar nucleotide-binding protein n=1 Tax=Sphingobium bisphenolivorans TaxID=1335760 RepID=UPI00039D6A37|nr:sugar nucleotide-binding protein [Sphingobium bisphenolivorans]
MTNHPQLWGGLECTVNRVGDDYRDQIRLSGHEERLDDLDRFASLAIRAIRYPILWERVSPDAPDACDWSWSDPRLARLRELGIDVIAGLVHHGSGPRYTSLIDAGFAEGLACHAERVAERYPWITNWTPVNEPLTTARFSTLYGLWYPHLRSERDFWLALFNQVDATRLAMRAVRRVNPAARLIQTDDLGRTYATASLRDQAWFDNQRRWLGWDLLCGRITPDHPFWPRVAAMGLEHRLAAILDDPCPPSIIGINHYLTSDRFLDHRLHRYPRHTHGGNERQPYADVEAVRVLNPPSQGLAGALREAWERYGLPLAVTEVHNGCTREEQLRWTAQAWDVAVQLRSEGVPVEAVTLWSLLGSRGWNTLLTSEGIYEPGAWDVSGAEPRPTAMVPLARSLANGSERPAMAKGAGWWQRPTRIAHPAVARPAPVREHLVGEDRPSGARPLLICGATGTLGKALAGACAIRNIPFVLTSRDELDLNDRRSIDAALDRVEPWAVVNAAGWVRVDDAEAAQAECLAANARGAVALAEACGDRDLSTLSFSSDLVFDGRKDAPYVESDPVRPLNVYGRSKADMEEGIARLPGSNLVVRTAAFFSPYDEYNFAVAAARTLARRESFAAADDLIVTPTYVPDLTMTSLDLLIDGETGIWHLSNDEALSWADFARRVAQSCGFDPALVQSAPHRSFGWPAPRPSNAALTSQRGSKLLPLSRALTLFAEHHGAQAVQAAA